MPAQFRAVFAVLCAVALVPGLRGHAFHTNKTAVTRVTVADGSWLYISQEGKWLIPLPTGNTEWRFQCGVQLIGPGVEIRDRSGSWIQYRAGRDLASSMLGAGSVISVDPRHNEVVVDAVAAPGEKADIVSHLSGRFTIAATYHAAQDGPVTECVSGFLGGRVSEKELRGMLESRSPLAGSEFPAPAADIAITLLCMRYGVALAFQPRGTWGYVVPWGGSTPYCISRFSEDDRNAALARINTPEYVRERDRYVRSSAAPRRIIKGGHFEIAREISEAEIEAIVSSWFAANAGGIGKIVRGAPALTGPGTVDLYYSRLFSSGAEASATSVACSRILVTFEHGAVCRVTVSCARLTRATPDDPWTPPVIDLEATKKTAAELRGAFQSGEP